ncbi:YkuS family protein [Paludifilum halophilum]|uniref:Uncharacterized protein n=1 Tax=Paludifilum halophilum TaxID=1642702 RepID=A0A235B6B6_9BACL|nr:YkuS family protein [Paludifilum halophilum]OYD07782.1 hypothetical protein CHM34_09970 [Paludifilum halophilum]
MSKQRIAVEEGLQPVRHYLEGQGYEVVDLAADQLQNCGCCVISGGDKDVMGMADIAADISVINADGMSPEEVHRAVRQRVNIQ